MLDPRLLTEVLISMLGFEIRTASRVLLKIGDITAFPTRGHLAAYAGLAPVTRRSGSAIRGEHPTKGGNKALNRAIFLATFASLADPLSRAYYDQKRAEAKGTTPPSSASPAAQAAGWTPVRRSPT